MSTITTMTAGREITARWYRENHPTRVLQLDDGRIKCTYADGREKYLASVNELYTRHPHAGIVRCPQAERIEAPAMPATYTVSLDWTAMHHALAAVDRARRAPGSPRGLPGHNGVTDAFGGSYFPQSSLLALLEALRGVDLIARDAWTIVHEAHRTADIGGARYACRVAIACSRVYALMHEAGLIDDPTHRICGTGRAYGLHGLAWLAGEEYDSAQITTEQVDRYVSGADVSVFARRSREVS